MQDENIAPAVLYAAKSTVDKRGSNATQLDDGRAFAEREGLTVVAEYADEDASAYSGNRGPELAAALDHAEHLEGSLIVQHSDRLARGDGVKARHLVQLVFEAKSRGIRLRSVEDDSSLESVLMAAAMGVIVAVLAAFGTIVAFFSVTTSTYPFILLLNVAVFVLAAAFGVVFLVRTLERLVAAAPMVASVGSPCSSKVISPESPS